MSVLEEKMVKNMRIETNRLIIRPYKQEDLMECFQLMQDKELFKYLDMEVMTLDKYKELFTWIIRCYNVSFDKDFKYSFNVSLKESGTHIGWCGIGGLCFNHGIKSIYYLIGKDYWGNGYASEASKALLDYGFNVMNLEEIVAIVQPENIASKRVIEKMGMKYQYTLNGLPTEFDWNNGELLYSLTQSEYFKM